MEDIRNALLKGEGNKLSKKEYNGPEEIPYTSIGVMPEDFTWFNSKKHNNNYLWCLY